MTFNINDYKGDYVMWCKTKEEAENFCNYLHKAGRTWIDGDKYCDNNCFRDFGSDTAYFFNEGTLDSVQNAKRLNFKVLKWNDFMEDTFTKSDLKSGMVIEYADGVRGLIINNKIFSTDGLMSLEDYDEHLIDTEEISGLNINKVYINNSRKLSSIFDDNKLTLIWERKQPPTRKLTLEELEKILGCKVEIVSD